MRRFIAAFLLLGALIYSKEVAALDCLWLPPNAWYQSADDSEAPLEKQRQDKEARATLQLLERTPIVFRGRIASARYLSDLRKTNTPTSLLVFDRVEILKGRLSRTFADRKAFIIKQEWCDHSCNGRAAATSWPRGEIVLVGARPNDFVDSSKAVEFGTKRIIFTGRIDAVLGICDVGRLSPIALELLNAPDDEIVRLKREYRTRQPN